MKKSLLLTALLLAAATTASAQFAGGKSNGAHSSNTASTENWNRVFVSYNPMSLKTSIEDGADLDLNGFSVGYSHGFSLSRNLPLFIELAPQVTYAFAKEDTIDILEEGSYYEEIAAEISRSYLALNVPVSVAYKFSLRNENISLVPYLGLNFRGNILAKEKFTSDGESDGAKMNCFDENDMGEDYTWNRFQLGGQVGVGMNYKHLYVGVGYTFDFMELAKKTKVSMVNITVGYNF